MKIRYPVLALLLSGVALVAQVPENLVADGVPAIPPELRAEVGCYLVKIDQ